MRVVNKSLVKLEQRNGEITRSTGPVMVSTRDGFLSCSVARMRFLRT